MQTEAGYFTGAGNGEGPVVTRGPLNLEARDRLNRLHCILTETNGALGSFRERMLGPWPESAPAQPGGGATRGPVSFAEELLAALDQMIEAAHRAQYHVEVLSGAL